MDNAQVTQEAREAAAIALGYKNFADATDYRLTGEQDREVARMVQAFAKFERDTLARHRLERSEPVKEARYTLITLARVWWQRNMNSHCRSVSIKGDGRVDVHWSDSDESGSYTLPVDFVSEVLPTTPPEPVAEIERLRGALREISGYRTELNDRSDYARGWNEGRFQMRGIARAALGDAS